jgi:hypothetical protein
VADSDDFISARIDKYNADGSVIQGQTLPVVDSEITLIQSKEYYKISRSILATEGDAEFRLVLYTSCILLS